MLVSALSLCCSTKMKSEGFNWSDIRVFLAVFRAGSTLKASKLLGLAQPTVARRIEALEHASGLTLFLRDTRGVKPTAHALALLPTAEAVEAAIGDFAKGTTIQSSRSAQAIRITAVPEVFSPNFSAIIADFKDRYPEIRFDFIATPNTLDIGKGEADVAIRYSNKIDDPNLICRKMSYAEITLYAHETYIAKNGLPKSEDDLANHDIVSFPTALVQFEEWLRARIPPERFIMECDTYNGLQAAIFGGFGIGPLGCGIGDTTPGLKRCIPPPDGLGATTWLLTSPEAHKRPEVQLFTKFFAPRYADFIKRQKLDPKATYVPEKR